jgi:hypothetical protein
VYFLSTSPNWMKNEWVWASINGWGKTFFCLTNYLSSEEGKASLPIGIFVALGRWAKTIDSQIGVFLTWFALWLLEWSTVEQEWPNGYFLTWFALWSLWRNSNEQNKVFRACREKVIWLDFYILLAPSLPTLIW